MRSHQHSSAKSLLSLPNLLKIEVPEVDGFAGLLLLMLVEVGGFHLVELLEEVLGFFSDLCCDLLSCLGAGLLEWDFLQSHSK